MCCVHVLKFISQIELFEKKLFVYSYKGEGNLTWPQYIDFYILLHVRHYIIAKVNKYDTLIYFSSTCM